MNFIYPGFLFALAAIAIPIIVHLFNFRRFKRILFTNVRFLKEVKEETSSRAKLKHLLVLAARILAIILLVLAFAQPFIPNEGVKINNGETAVSVFIDNSFSMEAATTEGSLLDVAKLKARELLAAYGPNDQFQLLTNDFEGRHQRLLSKDEFLEALQEVKISPAYRSLANILSRQKDIFFNQKDKNKVIYVLSDFQKSMLDDKLLQGDTNYTIRLVPIEAPKVANVAIDSVAFLAPIHRIEDKEQLLVYLHNSGDKDVAAVPIKLLVNGEQKAIGSLSIAAGAKAADTLIFSNASNGIQQGEVQIADYPISFDNTYQFTWTVAGQLNILCIDGKNPNPFIDAVYQSDPFFKLQHVGINQIDYSSLNKYALIIMDEALSISSGLTLELKKFVKAGGSLVLFPSFDADLGSYNSFLATMGLDHYAAITVKENKVTSINLQEGVFKGVFTQVPSNASFPQVKHYFTIEKRSRSNAEFLMQLQSKESILNKYAVGKGKVYLSGIPLQETYSNLCKHALFLPLMYRMALLSSTDLPLAYTIGVDYSIQAPALSVQEKKQWKLKKADFEMIPDIRSSENGTRLFVSDQLKEAGLYQLQAGNEQGGMYAFNYNRKESDLSYAIDELNSSLEAKNIQVLEEGKRSLKDRITEANYGIRLWKLCIILALLFLAIEVLLLRYWDRLILFFK